MNYKEIKNYKVIKEKKYQENKEKLEKIKNNKTKKILILSCGTGGGHNSAAKAIKEVIMQKGVQADFIEYLF